MIRYLKSGWLQICSFYQSFLLVMPKTKDQIALVSFLKRMMRANWSVALNKKSNKSDLHFEKSESHFRSFALKIVRLARKLKSEFPTLVHSLNVKCLFLICLHYNFKSSLYIGYILCTEKRAPQIHLHTQPHTSSSIIEASLYTIK